MSKNSVKLRVELLDERALPSATYTTFGPSADQAPDSGFTTYRYSVSDEATPGPSDAKSDDHATAVQSDGSADEQNIAATDDGGVDNTEVNGDGQPGSAESTPGDTSPQTGNPQPTPPQDGPTPTLGYPEPTPSPSDPEPTPGDPTPPTGGPQPTPPGNPTPPDNPAPKSITGSVTITGDSNASAEKGSYTPPAGVERKTTDADMRRDTPHFMQYDGATEFKADYTIGLNADGSFDPKTSSVTLTTVTYTSSSYVVRGKDEVSAEEEAKMIKDGKKVVRNGDDVYIFSKPTVRKDGWKTVSIPITDAVIKDGKLVSFKFKGDTWYGNKPASIEDKGIEGSIDLGTGKATFTAKYQLTNDGAIATYVVTGTVKN